MPRMWKRVIMLAAALALTIALLPPTASLYELTGEEALSGQLRGVLHWFNSAIRPQPDLAPDAQIARQPSSIFGANTFLQQEVLPEVREESLRLLDEAGFSYIRQEFPWEDIEIHGKGDFTDRRNDLDGDGQPDAIDAWAKYDDIVERAANHDIEIIARLGNPPAWTRVMTDTIGTHAPPDNFEDYGDFVAAVVERYRGQIRYFQLWNEPNIYPEWGEQPVDPEAYTELLCTGYQRAKAANPDAVIIAGALSPTVSLSDRDLNDLIFLQRMYAAGAGDCFDIFSAQGYGLWSGPTDMRLRPTVINYPHNLFLRDIMTHYGDAELPIWISEMGWNSVPEGIFPAYGRVTEEQQAAYGIQAYERAQIEWPWAGVVNYWFFKRPSDQERDQAWYYFRMLEPDFTPLPVWESVSAYAAADPQPAAQAGWLYTWQQLRPALALLGGSLLFFGTLLYLAPDE